MQTVMNTSTQLSSFLYVKVRKYVKELDQKFEKWESTLLKKFSSSIYQLELVTKWILRNK